MAFMPLFRTRLIARLCAMVGACGPFADPASRGFDDDVASSFQGEQGEFCEDRRPQPRISFSAGIPRALTWVIWSISTGSHSPIPTLRVTVPSRAISHSSPLSFLELPNSHFPMIRSISSPVDSGDDARLGISRRYARPLAAAP
jgi:hypothetical protein